jgi:hypothetical protein
MNIYLVQTARETVNRSSDIKRNKIHLRNENLHYSKILVQNEMVNGIFIVFLFINFHFL